ncbi:MAG TPA: alpha/beta fold hydrolase [bacterium]|nr:alpha/beta fold hydrolase [bacterium]
MRRLIPMAIASLLTGCLAFHRGPMPGEPASATFADVDGARVRYVDVGSGPAVVLVHGFASSLETWAAVMPELSRNHRVIALDLKGFGWTDRPRGDYSPEAQAKIVLDLLSQRGVDRAAFVGHSWGASVVLAAALAAPQRVTRLALYDAWAFEDQLPSFFLWSRVPGLGETLFGLYYDQRPDERLAAAFYDKKYLTEDLAEAVDKAMKRPGTRAAALAAARGQRYSRMQERYRTIQQPALLLWGKEDRVALPSIGERLAAELPHSKLVVYPRCGHFPMIEAAAQSNDALASFLAEDAK